MEAPTGGGQVTHILAIDQGTTSTRALVFDGELRVVAQAQREFPQHYPASGWVEHDPEDLWTTTVETCREAVAGPSAPSGSPRSASPTSARRR